MREDSVSRSVDPRWFRLALIAVPLLLAVISAHPYAGSWNDGSRLATVEAIVDYGTLAMDQSVFVKVPQDLIDQGIPPYPLDNSLLLQHGTSDKVQIDGHFYSDKPAVISYLMAVPYQIWRWVGGPSFRERPDLVCYFLTLFTSGLAYVLSIWGLYQLTIKMGLRSDLRMALVGCLAFSTITLPYLRHVNNHILLMAVMMGILNLIHSPLRGWQLLKLGTLLGIGYNLDLGLGPVLLAGVLGLLLYRTRSLYRTGAVCIMAMPWVAAQLGINYALGGVWKPINTVPEYLAWEGSPFTAQNLTGFLRHDPGRLAVYSLALMFGKHGFIGHNLPLFLLLPALFFLLRRSQPRLPEILFSLIYCLGGWGMYSLFSNNYGGASCSVRWFVPFLAPGFYILAEFLKQHPEYRWDLYALGCWGAVMGTIMWIGGPWIIKMIPMYWPVQGAGLLTWIGVRRWRWKVEARTMLKYASQPSSGGYSKAA